ncbi:ribosomal RNA large subunit methyltransferase N [Spiroplasma syrphidicola EA-1]|uniref:Probable dual-specificity RNA methyltransferase RlmN n=1 Tax=Spiroplasma syrphidicola EA-1 TaxID=1276229 RepID=R4U4J0_9MOLU|nr:23S rRNA (adenine(2503)-C(2))-methyltransferase RlmN [Spiroplasma syrphidicola]AGM26402.1 ribosomal RNA large subunit methyltransferase N [Spiroplasma syrphidicola EA-1]
MQSFFDFTKEKLQSSLVENGFKRYLADQLFDWVYVKNILSFDEMTNISKGDREKLKEFYTLSELEIVVQQESKDGTVKFLFKLKDGLKIETVLMRQNYGNSVCVTTQVGCNMACTFCASGLLKKTRNLSTGEIVAQVMMVNRYLQKAQERVSHIVVMGIGEPFDNFENVIDFVKVINDPKGYQIGARHITISTCGLVPKIKQFADLNLQVNLAISLHAPNNAIRNQLMPINKAYPLEKLMEAINYYLEKTNRRITFEYILINNVNDSRENAVELAKLIRGMNAYVNLIPYNAVAENDYQRSTRIEEFFTTLQNNRINCIVRREFGHDIDAACGQLRAKNEGVLKK